MDDANLAHPPTAVESAGLILDRAHGKPAYLQDPNRDPDFVPPSMPLSSAVRDMHPRLSIPAINPLLQTSEIRPSAFWTAIVEMPSMPVESCSLHCA
jgi:hypothetical protein